METEWLKIGIIPKKEGVFKKSHLIGWQLTPEFPFYHYPSVMEVLTQIGTVKLEIERMLELSDAGALIKEYRNRWDKAESLLKEYYKNCKTVEELSKQYPTDIAEKLQKILHPDLESEEESKAQWKLKAPE